MPINVSTAQLAIVAGTTLRTTATFSDLTTGELADPGTVKVGYDLNSGTPVQTTYGSGPVVKDGTGIYYWDIDTTGFAAVDQQMLMVIYWQGIGGIDVTSPPVLVTVNGPPFVLT